MPIATKIYERNNVDSSEFTLGELNSVLKSSKGNKQPGPDNVIMELLKLLDSDNRKTRLKLMNGRWISKTA